MGQKHGRIIQASLDGENLVLQYSQLWSFEDDDTAPVELFVRYNIGQPVGLERPEERPDPGVQITWGISGINEFELTY